jgi:hypothetical protein
MIQTHYPSKEDYIPMDDTYEFEFRNRLDYFDNSYRNIIVNTPSLRNALMQDDYKTSVINIIKSIQEMKKRLTQKLQQLIDNLPTGKKRKEAKEDLLSLKLSESDYHYIMLADKYKDNL